MQVALLKANMEDVKRARNILQKKLKEEGSTHNAEKKKLQVLSPTLFVPQSLPRTWFLSPLTNPTPVLSCLVFFSLQHSQSRSEQRESATRRHLLLIEEELINKQKVHTPRFYSLHLHTFTPFLSKRPLLSSSIFIFSFHFRSILPYFCSHCHL